MPHLSIRCSQAEKDELEMRSGGNISLYIRQQLFAPVEGNDALLHRLDDLREDLLEALEARQPSPSRGQHSPPDSDLLMASILEMLLMMRSQFRTEARRQAMGEVERLGLTPFESETFLEQRENRNG